MNAELNSQSQSPLIISEANYASVDLCQAPPFAIEHEGAYQMDLFTWLYDHLGYSGTVNYPVRTIWFEEMDDLGVSGCSPGSNYPPDLGVYGSNSTLQQPNQKEFYSPYLTPYYQYYYFTCPRIFGNTSNFSMDLSTLYFFNVLVPCY